MYWLPFIIVVILGGLLLLVFVVADIPVLNALTSDNLDVENQISYTVSATSGMQLFHTLMYTGSAGTTTQEQIRKHLMCAGKEDNGCTTYPSEDEITQQITDQIDGLLTVDGLGSGRYFFAVRRDGEPLFNVSKGVSTGLPLSEIETIMGEQHTSITFPVNTPDGGNASVRFMTDIGSNTITVRAGR